MSYVFNRNKLPDTRVAVNHKFKIKSAAVELKGYINVGLYEDGRPGELFVTMDKTGSTINGLIDSLCMSVSFLLQAGMPVGDIAEKFAFQRFEPAGMTGDPDIPFATSVTDYIFRWLGNRYCPEFKKKHARTEVKDENPIAK